MALCGLLENVNSGQGTVTGKRRVATETVGQQDGMNKLIMSPLTVNGVLVADRSGPARDIVVLATFGEQQLSSPYAERAKKLPLMLTGAVASDAVAKVTRGDVDVLVKDVVFVVPQHSLEDRFMKSPLIVIGLSVADSNGPLSDMLTL